MSNAIRTVSLRNLGAHKVRLALTVIAVMLGTAFIAGSFVFTDTLNGAFNQIITKSQKGLDVEVTPVKSTNPGVPIALADQIRGLPGVRAVQPQASQQIVLIGPDGKKVSSGQAPAQGGIWTSPADSIGDPATFVSGTPPSGPDQIVVNDGAAKTAHLQTGDHVKVITLAHGPVDATISGIYHVDFATGAYIGVLFSEQRGLQLFTDGTHVSAIDVAASSGVSQQSLRNSIGSLLPSDLQAKTGAQVHQDSENALQKALSFVNYFLLAFGAIALLVGTFIIYNTFSMIVAQRLRELALLRAIGADRKQLRRAVVFEAAVIGLIGSVLGTLAGIGLAFGLRAFLDAINVGLPNGSTVVSARTVVVALVVGIGVTVVSAYSPARRAARIAPVAAMREQFATTTAHSLQRRNIIGLVLLVFGAVATVGGATSSSGGSSAALTGLGLLGVGGGVLMLAPTLSGWVIGVLGAVLGRPFGAVGRLARTNSVRNPRRTAATAFALTVGLLLVSGIAVIGASTKASLNTIVDNDVRADYILTGSSFGVPTGAAAAAARVGGVKSLTELHPLDTTIAGSDTSGIAVDGPLAAIVKLDMLHGGGTTEGTSMLVSKSEAASRNWHVGSRVTLTTAGGASVTETVTGVYANSPLMGPWLVSGTTYRALVPTNEYFDEVALVVAKPGTNLATLRSGLEQATDPYYVIDVQNRGQFKGSQAAQVNGLLGILYGLLGLAIVIAILGIVNTLALSVVERRREIGMLRAVGMQRAQVRRTIYLESALIALFGAVLGLALGLGFGTLFTRTLRRTGLNVLDVPWGQALFFLILAGVVGVLAAVWPGIRAARTPPLAVIAEG